MKHKLAIIALLLFTTSSFAQNTSDTFGEGDNVIGLGLGVGGVYGLSGFATQTPAFGIHFDHGFKELSMGGVIGLGGYVGHKGFDYDIVLPNGKYYDKWSITILGARGSFHYDLLKVENLDTYGGAMLAFHILNSKNNLPNGYPYSRNYSSDLYASLFAGMKYYFTDNVGAFLELGYGVSWATVGASFKF